MQPHISVIIPAFNEQHMIQACLEAVLNQSILPDVIYVIDNNSSDLTARIAEKYDRVIVINEKEQGICAATKKGLDTAAKHNGLLLRCDADSCPKQDWIEIILATFSENNTAVAVTGPGEVYDTTFLIKHLFAFTYMKPYFFLVGLALKQTPLFGSNFAIKASVWKEISEITHLRSHQSIHDDIDISYHLIGKGDTIYSPRLSMPISARPLRSLSKMRVRYRAGFDSIFLHWPDLAPWNIHTNKK